MVTRSDIEKLRIERAQASDAPLIADLSRRVIENGLQHRWRSRRILRYLRQRESLAIVARLREWPVAGFALMEFGESSAHLSLLGIDSQLRRRGLGRCLMQWLEKIAVNAGTFDVVLELRATNTIALSFYRALGYRESAVHRGYYDGIEDAIILRRFVGVEPQL